MASESENSTKKSWKVYSAEEKIQFLKNNVAEDCVFLVGMEGEEEPKEIKSFKFILSSISPVFERMFHGHFKEAKNSDPILIKDIFAIDFETFLKYAYDMKVHVENWKSLYDIAKKYMAEELIKSIIDDLRNNLKKTPLEAVQLFEIMYFENMAGTVKKPPDYKPVLKQAFSAHCPYIFGLNFEVFLHLLTILKDQFTVTQLFQAIEHYCSIASKFTTESLKLQLTNLLLNEIDFRKMTLCDFYDYVDGSNLLDQSAKYKILRDVTQQYYN